MSANERLAALEAAERFALAQLHTSYARSQQELHDAYAAAVRATERERVLAEVEAYLGRQHVQAGPDLVSRDNALAFIAALRGNG